MLGINFEEEVFSLICWSRRDCTWKYQG